MAATPLVAVAELVEQKATDELVPELLFELDGKHCLACILCYMENMKYQKMAELLEIPSGAMMSRLSRAKNQSNNFFSKESAAMADRRST